MLCFFISKFSLLVVLLQPLLTSGIDEDVAESSGSDDDTDLNATAVRSHPQQTSQLSRLHSEFEELEWLGKGGYGDVVKVSGCVIKELSFSKCVWSKLS